MRHITYRKNFSTIESWINWELAQNEGHTNIHIVHLCSVNQLLMLVK